MTPSRILLIGAGLGIVLIAIILVLRGFSGISSAPRPAGDSGVAGAAPNDAGQAGEDALPLWRDFMRPGDPATATPRPVASTEIAFVSPFDRAYALAELEKSALRLEGVASGNPARALISGRVVRVGDKIDAFRISRINSSGVLLEGPAGVQLELTLGASVLPDPSEPGI